MNRPYATYLDERLVPVSPPEVPQTLALVVTVEPADTTFLDIKKLLRESTELCRRLNVEAVKVTVGKVTYYVHKDHVVKRTERNEYEVLREPFDGK